MYAVRSGFTIECVSDAFSSSILSAGSLFKSEVATIKSTFGWVAVVVPHVPLYIIILGGSILVTNEMVASECLTGCDALFDKAGPNKVELGQYSASCL